MADETEDLRRAMVAELNTEPAQDRAEAEARWGQVWDTAQLSADFAVQGFLAPFVIVKRRSDGKRGTLMFQHAPRFYFGFEPEA